MFNRILIANRGEIALRIIRACRELGIESVVVYSQADRDAAYLKLADQAICIGPAPPGESYLNIPRIISAAELANVEAIHPGYGFLAENSHFAEICRSSKIEFIGPSVKSMAVLGDKIAARRMAKQNRIPIIPGSEGAVEDEEQALQIAGKIGYPVMIKAAGGGGGRGIRVAHNDIALQSNFRAAKAEAEVAFKDSPLYIEKFVEKPRHVEVQILADHHGNVVHLWERDCTLQRRHQKLVEETPCPVLKPKVRTEICRCAVKLARAAGYTNAGTFEFLLDKKQNFYFMEANTRIQVEHPITEMVTGIDLIKWQLRIASGDTLDFKQSQVPHNGTAIECRINAEDPSNGFMPCPGLIEVYQPPGGPGVRLDTHVYAGYEISPRYDSLIGKLIVHKPDREQAIACMKRALHEFRIEPIKTTIPLYLEVFDHVKFIRGNVDTTFIERTW